MSGIEAKLGLTPHNLNICKLCIGSGRPPRYFELGLQNNALQGKRIPESVFRPQFLDTMAKGLVAWANDKQGRIPFKMRQYAVTDRGWLAVADVAILEGEDYTYAKTFDGTEASLKKLQTKGRKTEIKFRDRKKGVSIGELFRNMPKSVQDKIKAANPNWRSMVE